jgi:hypothetical protein
MPCMKYSGAKYLLTIYIDVLKVFTRRDVFVFYITAVDYTWLQMDGTLPVLTQMCLLWVRQSDESIVWEATLPVQSQKSVS